MVVADTTGVDEISLGSLQNIKRREPRAHQLPTPAEKNRQRSEGKLEVRGTPGDQGARLNRSWMVRMFSILKRTVCLPESLLCLGRVISLPNQCQVWPYDLF
jgi:hypothetical protein